MLHAVITRKTTTKKLQKPVNLKIPTKYFQVFETLAVMGFDAA
jgi:hypothetical protein